MAGSQQPVSNIKHQEFLSDLLNTIFRSVTRAAENFDRSEITLLGPDIQQSTAYPALDRAFVGIIVFAEIDPMSAGDTVNRHALLPLPVSKEIWLASNRPVFLIQVIDPRSVLELKAAPVRGGSGTFPRCTRGRPRSSIAQRLKKLIFLGFNLLEAFLDIPHSMQGTLPLFVLSEFLHFNRGYPHVRPVGLIDDIGLSRYSPDILQASNGSFLMSHGTPSLSLFLSSIVWKS
jgi:hypothetical protein